MYNNNQVTAILQYADITLFLGADDFEFKKYFNWVDQNPELEMIYVISDVLKYYQPYLLGTSPYDKLVNYLNAEIGNYRIQAQIISNNNNGVIVGLPITTTYVPATVISLGYTANGGESSISFGSAIGRLCLYVSRGGITAQRILTAGIPSGEDVLWDTTTGTLTFARTLLATEYVLALFE